MMNTHVSSLNHTVEETKGWLDDLCDDGPFENEQQAYSHLRAVLHAVRDRLTVEEAAHLASQLPMLVRGFYYEGWRPALAPNKDRKEAEDFLDAVRISLNDPGASTATGADGNAESSREAPEPTPESELRDSVGAVLTLLTKRLPEGQIRHVRGQMPEAMREIWPA